MKIITLFIPLIFYSFVSHAQLKSGSKVFLTFEDTKDKRNVDSEDAKIMLKTYIDGKTSLVILDNKLSSDYILQLRIIKMFGAIRKGKLDIIDNQTQKLIFESRWVAGSSSRFYGFSGTRHAIAKLVKNQLIDAFPDIRKK